MKKLIIAILAVSFSAICGSAQSYKGYTLDKSTGVYTSISDGTEVLNADVYAAMGNNAEIKDYVFGANGVLTKEPKEIAGIPIGFEFPFCGLKFSNFAISGDGWIKLGGNTINVTPTASRSYFTDGLSSSNSFGVIPIGQFGWLDGATISYKTQGDELIIQYDKVAAEFWFMAPDIQTPFSFQIRLQKSGVITYIFKNMNEFESPGAVVMALVNNEGDYLAITGSTLTEAECDPNSTSVSNVNIADTPAGFTMTLNPPADCIKPTYSEGSIAMQAFSTSLEGEIEIEGKADGYVVLLSTSPTLTATPQDGTNYVEGESLGGAVIVSAGAESEFSCYDLNSSTTFYVNAYPYNGYCNNGPIYGNPVTLQTATLPAAPQSFTIGAPTLNTIPVSVQTNELGDDVIILVTETIERSNYGDHGLFGTPTGDLKVGDTVEGGGKVVYKGGSAEGEVLSGFEPSTVYFFVAYSVNDENKYSYDRIYDSAVTILVPPVENDFSNEINFQMPTGWKGEGGTYNADGTIASEITPGVTQTNINGQYRYVLWANFMNVTANGAYAAFTTSPIKIEQANYMASFTYSAQVSASRFDNGPWQCDNNGSLSLQASKDGGLTFEDLFVYTKANYPEVSSINDLVTIRGDLSDYVGETIVVRLLWKTYSQASFGSKLIITQFEVQQSDVPVITSVSDITHNSATVNWMSKYSRNQICLVDKGQTPGEDEGTYLSAVDTNSVMLKDLSEATDYDVYVRGVFEVNVEPSDGNDVTEVNYSEWSEPYSFRTAEYPDCEVPTNLTADIEDFQTEGIITLNWDSSDDAYAWDVNYRASTATSWEAINELEECTLVLEDLDSDTVYLWRVRSACTRDRVSSWSGQATFTTPVFSGISAAEAGRIRVEGSKGVISVINDRCYIDYIAVYDASGKQIGYVNVDGDYSATIPVNTSGIVMVKVALEGKTLTYKVAL